MARLDRVGPKGHGDSFDLQAGLIGGQRSDAKAVNDLSGEMQGKRLGIDVEEMERGFQEAAARALAPFARPQDTMKTAEELSNNDEVADGTMQRVDDLFTPKAVRDRNRRISDEARLREETKQAIQPEPEEEADEWEQIPDVEEVYADWGQPMGVAPLTAADALDRHAALDELQNDDDGE
jgi:hypothetical protein